MRLERLVQLARLDDIDRANPPCTACGADMMGLERLASLTAGPWCHMCKGRVEWRFEELNAIQSICDWYATSAMLRRLRAERCPLCVFQALTGVTPSLKGTR